MDIIMKTINVNEKKNQSTEMCSGLIDGVTPYHHTIIAGSQMDFEANIRKYHIMTLVQGTAVFMVEGKEYRFDERVTFIPGLDQKMTIKAETDVQLMEILFEMTDEDFDEIEKFNTEFPYMQVYKTSMQYKDKCKTNKTINRIMVEQRHVPRFAMGSVESYGPDHVGQHPHPMLDQYFFSFPENNMTVLIEDERVPMPGNTLLYIPLGSNHGVEVKEGEVMHYTWIDFLVDREESATLLDEGHVLTGLQRSFDNEDKTRQPNQ